MNDNVATFNITSLSRNVLENSPIGTIIGEFEVVDLDEGMAGENYFSLIGTDSDR